MLTAAELLGIMAMLPGFTTDDGDGRSKEDAKRETNERASNVHYHFDLLSFLAYDGHML